VNAVVDCHVIFDLTGVDPTHKGLDVVAGQRDLETILLSFEEVSFEGGGVVLGVEAEQLLVHQQAVSTVTRNELNSFCGLQDGGAGKC